MSARTIRVLLAFSMVNFVLPSWPAIRPMHRVRLAHREKQYDILPIARET